jgi:hypothetical protein
MGAELMKKQRKQNPVAVAMRKRHGKTTTKMKDRRAPRGGARNKQKEYREDGY